MSFIGAVMEYGHIVWDNFTASESEVLEDIQTSARKELEWNMHPCSNSFSLPRVKRSSYAKWPANGKSESSNTFLLLKSYRIYVLEQNNGVI